MSSLDHTELTDRSRVVQMGETDKGSSRHDLRVGYWTSVASQIVQRTARLRPNVCSDSATRYGEGHLMQSSWPQGSN